ncbi:MAG: hypothetical protein KDA44_09175 [Planctomycetales bacterium]|nr:hypothetical protein [Planctomycetales bacterium]
MTSVLNRIAQVSAVVATLWLVAPPASCFGGDVGVVSLFNGERTNIVGSTNYLNNNWGGGFGVGSVAAVARDTSVAHQGNSVAHQGNASIRADLGTIPAGGLKFFQTFSSELANQSLRQTRDLTRFDSFEAYVRNGTGVPLTLKFELKDYRDDVNNQVNRSYSIPAGSGWTKISAPLDATLSGWTKIGNPDLSRTYAASFIVAGAAGPATGSIYVDDFSLTERGGPLDAATAPIASLAERLAERQFSGLWTARNRATGLVYNTTDDANAAAMNTTAGVLWMLPAAVQRGWVSQADADQAAGQIAASLNTNLNLNSNGYLPTRFINPATAGLPGGDNEQSSIDASFIALALHRYKSQPTTSPALATTLDAVENRFQLDAFRLPGKGFALAYKDGTGFTTGAYDGYTNEGKVISLAAAASTDHNVPLAERWNTDVNRARTFLVNPSDAHLVHSSTLFRAPFEQALLNLFVDTSDRGVDNFPTRSLATNPWENYVRYERETAARLDQLGRDGLFQSDAGQGTTGSPGYQQYSLYNDFGQGDLIMPWSVALALLAGAPGADDALRTFMGTDLLNGPLGLADTARWATGASGPTNVPSYQDNWNMVLSTMALLEYLDGPSGASRSFAELPEIAAELDTVFKQGDVNGDGVTNSADLSIWAAGFGIVAGATPAQGDVSGDARVDGGDFLRWQRGYGIPQTSAAQATVAEPSAGIEAAALILFAAVVCRWRRSLREPVRRAASCSRADFQGLGSLVSPRDCRNAA